MLVLSRKSTESIHIGDSVVVTVLEIRGKKVRMGIDAPKEILVRRSELQDVSSWLRKSIAPWCSPGQSGAQNLAERLARSGIKATAIHGNKPQSARQRALAAFQRKQVQVQAKCTVVEF